MAIDMECVVQSYLMATDYPRASRQRLDTIVSNLCSRSFPRIAGSGNEIVSEIEKPKGRQFQYLFIVFVRAVNTKRTLTFRTRVSLQIDMELSGTTTPLSFLCFCFSVLVQRLQSYTKDH